MSAEEPLLLVVEIEPTETAFFSVGQSVRVHLNIVDADEKQQTDPDVLTFTVTAPFTAPVTYTYGVGSKIVQNEQGNYQADVELIASGKWMFQYVGTLNSISCGSNTTVIYTED